VAPTRRRKFDCPARAWNVTGGIAEVLLIDDDIESNVVADQRISSTGREAARSCHAFPPFS
jgi:hypothetical protein